MRLLTRTHGRPGRVRLYCFLSARPRPKDLVAFGPNAFMYRYRHNRRLRAAFLLDHRLGRVRG